MCVIPRFRVEAHRYRDCIAFAVQCCGCIFELQDDAATQVNCQHGLGVMCSICGVQLEQILQSPAVQTPTPWGLGNSGRAHLISPAERTRDLRSAHRQALTVFELRRLCPPGKSRSL